MVCFELTTTNCTKRKCYGLVIINLIMWKAIKLKFGVKSNSQKGSWVLGIMITSWGHVNEIMVVIDLEL